MSLNYLDSFELFRMHLTAGGRRHVMLSVQVFQQSHTVELILADPQNSFTNAETQAKELRKKHGREIGYVVIAGK